jgi:hypothetical protein
MGPVLKNLLIAALLASAISAPACAAELVSNGGFESDYGLQEGWDHTVSSTLNIFVAPSASHSGVHALWFTAGADYVADFVSQTLDTVVGETYHYSYWVAGGSSSLSAPSGFEATIGEKSIGSWGTQALFDYVHVYGDYLAISDQTELTFTGFNSASIYFLDDVSVTGKLGGEIDLPGGPTFPGGGGGAVPEPQTWAMMLMGFAAIGAAVRRRRAGGLAVAA